MPFHFYSVSGIRSNSSKNSNSRSSNGSYWSSTTINATSYSYKKAKYPKLYRELKSPRVAKKALENWRKGATIEAPTINAPAIEAPQSLAAIEPNGADSDNPPSQPSTLLVPPHDTSQALTIRSINSLPPQQMTFSAPIQTQDKKGPRMTFICTLLPSYPNFDLECSTQYTDNEQRSNGHTSTTRGLEAVIATKENSWHLLFEKPGWNDDLLMSAMGADELKRLEEVDNPIMGRGEAGTSERWSKKIVVGQEWNLEKIWSVTENFYTVKIHIPGVGYRHKRLEW